MPPKRKATDDASAGSEASAPTKDRRPWTAAEEAAFNTHIDELVRDRLWDKVKNDPVLAGRKANGIRAHWIAKFKKMA